MKLHKILMLFAFMLTTFISTYADNITFDKKTGLLVKTGAEKP